MERAKAANFSGEAVIPSAKHGGWTKRGEVIRTIPFGLKRLTTRIAATVSHLCQISTFNI